MHVIWAMWLSLCTSVNAFLLIHSTQSDFISDIHHKYIVTYKPLDDARHGFWARTICIYFANLLLIMELSYLIQMETVQIPCLEVPACVS